MSEHCRFEYICAGMKNANDCDDRQLSPASVSLAYLPTMGGSIVVTFWTAMHADDPVLCD
jgi:hypothetical protein